jgi:hypothetical protein
VLPRVEALLGLYTCSLITESWYRFSKIKTR